MKSSLLRSACNLFWRAYHKETNIGILFAIKRLRKYADNIGLGYIKKYVEESRGAVKFYSKCKHHVHPTVVIEKVSLVAGEI